MKRAFSGILSVALIAGMAARADAASISLFFNGSYVDTAGEGANIQTALTNGGHTVSTFTGITAADFIAATAGGEILVFPEMELGNLFSDLDAAAQAALTAFVANGGAMIQANYFSANSNLPNGLFGYSLVQTASIGDTTLNAGAAAGTSFAGGPGILPGTNAVEGVLTTSLPLGALNLYSDGTSTSVFATTFGAGTYVYLGYDWFAGPDADWDNVLNRAVDLSAQAVPEPATLSLLGIGLAAVARRRLRRKA